MDIQPLTTEVNNTRSGLTVCFDAKSGQTAILPQNKPKKISMIPILSFCEYSQTIRQLPQNYVIAHKSDRKWICEPDLAADKELCTRVFLELMNFDSKYCQDGLELLARLTPNS